MTGEHWRPIRITQQVLADLGQGWRALVSYDFVCKFLAYAALAPLSAAFLNLLIQSSGDPAVSNYDLISFFLSWQGILLIVVVATVEFARIFFELGGLTLIGIGVRRGSYVSAPRALHLLATRMSQLVASSTATLSVRRTLMTWIAAGIAVAVALVAVVSTYTSLADVKNDNRVKVTAHRGSAHVAPENTRSALLQAIEDGADFAEIDVQETADGKLVLFHDTDLRRIMGDNRRVWQVTLAEMRELDAGSWFGAEFAGERVISLQEAIETVRGNMDLIIEMKYHGQERNLEESVIETIRGAQIGDRCMVTSLELRGVQEISLLDPQLRRGMIVTASIGDPTRLDINAIAVNSQQVTRNLIARAHRAGLEVFVWKVNDPALMLTMIHMGVDNIFTSRPKLLIEVLEERERLSETEQTLLYVADFLAGRL